MPEKNPTPEEVAAAVTELDSLLTFATPKSCAPDLLAIGVLTLPMLVRSKDQRKFHRAVHMVQPPVIAGRVCMRYIVTDAEMSALAGPEKEYRDKSRKPGLTPKEAVAIDNATHGDILVVPAVPRGQLRKLLSNATHGPLGAGCVLKIMSWFHVATTMLPTTPFNRQSLTASREEPPVPDWSGVLFFQQRESEPFLACLDRQNPGRASKSPNPSGWRQTNPAMILSGFFSQITRKCLPR